MNRALALLACLTLAACQDEAAQDVSPIAFSDTAIGHYCQMELSEHDGPKGQIHLAGLPGAPLFFSQVRDAIAYTRMPEQSHQILAIWVNDMGAEGATWVAPGAMNWIDAKTAHYVVGSRIEGGMGTPEIVPFSDRARAEGFAHENGGHVMPLAEIPDAAVLAPVAGDAPEDDSEFQRRLRALSRQTKG
ncbi:nitrous oxide reductase accessory protein NosL [Pseudorhodobacter sp.]|uniref:nitrous oxide reductase accessory protein NosL n=1 Tax=Pseudorhodobacter sp. TaxID=1934400 RepID=UPI002647F9A6|nr:nitrous oxide reductase accessory protein NosL [Pseudorhodobacter sp.]MDN5787044.1 nitrous oxide reductase accessory protein NosL [Pseudorhodobacter sp.]